MSGRRVSHYELLSLLGRGGMGEVWRARDPRIRREVAVKLIAPRLASDPEWRARFEREARAAGALNHPNILTVHDVGVDGDTPYLVTEVLEGESVRSLLARGPLPIRRLLALAGQIAEGLAAAHAHRIVHRDLKSENVFVTRDGRVKILDFGLARQGREDESASGFATASGVTSGTPGYMAPEQVRGERDVDARADLFSFGCVLYEMASGKPPFGVGLEAFHRILNEDPRPLAELRPDVPHGLAALVAGCLEKDRERRFQCARDLSLSLAAVGAGGGVPRRESGRSRAAWSLTIALAMLAVAAAGWFVLRPTPRALPHFRPLTFARGAVSSARVAPDGHTIVYAAAWGGPPQRLFVTRTEGPESSPLNVPPAGLASVATSGELAILLGYSFDRLDIHGFTLARVPLAGGAPRAIAENVSAADWRPGTLDLAIVRVADSGMQLEFPIGHIVYRTLGGIVHPRFSPRGDLIAFVDRPLANDDRGAVAIVDLKGKVRRLAPVGHGEHGLAWTPDGREIFFNSNRTSDEDAIWSVNLAGRLRLVSRTPGASALHDIGRDGGVLITQGDLRLRTLFASDSSAGEHDLSFLDWSLSSDLSPDGQLLLIAEESNGVGPSYQACIRRTDGSPTIKLGAGTAMSLSPDQRFVLSKLAPPEDRLMLLPTGPGQPVTLPSGPISEHGWGRWLPDGRRVLFDASEAGHRWRTYVQAVAGGPPRPITPEGVADNNMDNTNLITPDGRWVNITAPDGISQLYPIDGGSPRPIPGLAHGEMPLQWSADGTQLYVGTTERTYSWRIDRLDMRTGRRTRWRTLQPADPAGVLFITAPRITPDGRAYAYTVEQYLTRLYVTTGLR